MHKYTDDKVKRTNFDWRKTIQKGGKKMMDACIRSKLEIIGENARLKNYKLVGNKLKSMITFIAKLIM